MSKMKATLGVVAAIFNEWGEILLTRRMRHDSITDKDYCGCWELPVVAVQTRKRKPILYHYLSQQLEWGVERKLGVKISVDPIPPFYPVMFKGPEGYDLAMVTPVKIESLDQNLVIRDKIKKGEIWFVSPEILDILAGSYAPLKKDKDGGVIQEGRGLQSGKGKRQYCMAMKAFEIASPSLRYRKEAREELRRVQEGWK